VRALAPGVLALFLALPCRGEVGVQWPATLSHERRTLLTKALSYVEAHPGVPYRTGGSDAAGMDCSGAIILFLSQVDIHPPRSSQGQYEWLRREGRLISVGSGAKAVDDPVFRALQPGDLVFWGRMNSLTKGAVRVTHVHMFLGHEPDGRAVMIGSSDGRSYRGRRVRGLGIVDFTVPTLGRSPRILGFGSPLPKVQAR
jgi:cell wall-associated NlpC family hydrolase